MLYMIELHYSKEHRENALHYFLDHGAMNYDGKITLQRGWVATKDQVAYMLVRTRGSAEVKKACEPLKEFGEIFFRQVTSTDEI